MNDEESLKQQMKYGIEVARPKKVVFCIPAYPFRPHQATIDSLRDSVPAIEAAGWLHGFVPEIGNPYISAARATMLYKALKADATDVVFIDQDVSWRPQDMVKLLSTKGDVVSGTYRFKTAEESYMCNIHSDPNTNTPIVRASDGAVKATRVPGGFLRVTRAAVNHFMEKYPDLCYGEYCDPYVDLFNHGAHKRLWYGEDFAFSRNWIDAGGELWIVPDLNINHHKGDEVFAGNFHEYLLRQPGGSKDPNRSGDD